MKIPKAVQRNGSWRTQVTVHGRRMSFTRDTEEEAVSAALLAMVSQSPDEVQRQKTLARVTLRSAIDTYIHKRKNILSPATLRAYTSIKDNRFQGIMDLPLSEKIDWQMIVNEEAVEISAKTLKNCWGLIGSVLRENGIKVDKVILPQLIKNKRPFLQPEQITTFVEAIKGHKYELPYLLCLHGLRRSEMLALTKEDIYDDFIHVHGAVVTDMDGKLILKKENKNYSSQRNVPIMMPRLTDLVESCDTDKLCPWHPSTISKPLTTVCKHLGFPDIGLHGLRRSYASLCYHLGVSEAQTMEWGGWSDISTMRKIYIDIAEKDRAEKASSLKNFFMGQSVGKNAAPNCTEA